MATENETETVLDTVEAAYDQLAAETPEAPEPVTETEAPAVVEAETALADDKTEKPETREDGRDDKGRFAPKPGEKAPTTKLNGATATQTPTPEAKPPESAPVAAKAPQSLTPAEREAFSKWPADAQKALLRRDADVQKGFQDIAQVREVATRFANAISPYAPLIQASGQDPASYVGGLMQTVATLTHGNPGQKAAVLAQAMKAYGVPVEAFIAAYDGSPAPQQQQQEFRDPRVDQLYAGIAAQQQHAQRQAITQQSAEVQTFAASHEFFEDVRATMGDLFEMNQRRGIAKPLDALYADAVKLHPEISKVMDQREAAKRVANAQASTARSKAAGVSVKSGSTMAPKANGNGSIKDAAEAAYEELENRP